MQLRLKLWLEQDSRMAFGEGLYELLSNVQESGSITAAAARMRLAYREAWGRLHEAEEALGQPLLTRHAGGQQGGGAQLTPFGKSLMDTYAKLRDGLRARADELARLHLTQSP
jgi:molybdate transport system regulatory protein